MSIELDWQIVAEDAPPPDQASLPSIKPHRTKPRVIWIALAIVVLAVVSVAVCAAWAYRAGLAQASDQVRLVARLEAQAVAQGDQESFMALQDPDDSAWRSVQSKRFGQLEGAGLTEFGWTAVGASRQFGTVSLEPDGARLDVTYRFSVTQPLPGGPVTVSVQVPQYYKRTPSGWVRAMPGPDFWGGWRSSSGKRFAMRYMQRDAALLEPLIRRMDDMLDKVCGWLPCPSQPIFVIFDISPETLSHLPDFSYGFDDKGFILELVSPHLFGLPADARSRDEFYRAIGTRVVQALVYDASRRRLNMAYLSSQEIVRWELAQAGLAGPFITPAITRALPALLATSWRPLSAISLRSRPVGMDDAPSEALIPLALAFIQKQFGASSITRLLPALGNVTLSEAISAALSVDPKSLEPAWQEYLRERVGLSPSASPDGELALRCMNDKNKSNLWRIHADGMNLEQITSGDRDAWLPVWSPDGKRLAHLQDGFASLPRITDPAANRDTPYIWIADANGLNALRIAPSYEPEWSPDGKRLAFLGDVHYDSSGPTRGFFYAREVGIADVASGTVTTLVRDSDLLRALPGARSKNGAMVGLAWSPDGSMLAVAMYGPNVQPGVWVLNAETGVVRAQRSGVAMWWPYSQRAWSPDNRHLAVWATDSRRRDTLALFDAQTGQYVELPGASLDWSLNNLIERSSSIGFDWSPDGKWLAVTQDPSGLLLLTPDLSSMRWLDTPDCFDVAWRPSS